MLIPPEEVCTGIPAPEQFDLSDCTFRSLAGMYGCEPWSNVMRASTTGTRLIGIDESLSPQLAFDWMVEEAGPFLKWVGGKRRVLAQLLPLLPAAGFERYLEPFVGGAALFFALRPAQAVLADQNPALIGTYLSVRTELKALVRELQRHARSHSANYYYASRCQFNAARDDGVRTAGLFVYLNRTCFNGLYRENSVGEFNVPVGRYERPVICDERALRAASVALRQAELRVGSFETVLSYARPGDFVFFDPPYAPTSRTADFTSYTADGFDENKQDRLRDVFEALDRRGCLLMQTNSDTPKNRARYDRFDIREVKAPRSISSKSATRHSVTEIVVRNYA